MSDRRMIRKQLYITPEQERMVKNRARTEGVTEAEVVREAIDRYLLRHESGPHVSKERRGMLDELVEGNQRLSKNLRFPEGYRFNRAEVYAQREDRWAEQPRKS